MLLHWGNEYSFLQSRKQKKYADNFLRAGFDLIVGSHPHIFQGIDSISNTRVTYSLGNFAFDPYIKSGDHIPTLMPKISNFGLVQNTDIQQKVTKFSLISYRKNKIKKIKLSEYKINKFFKISHFAFQ